MASVSNGEMNAGLLNVGFMIIVLIFGFKFIYRFIG